MTNILLLGGTGAMGIYLVPELLNLGFNVVVTSRSTRKSDNNRLSYIRGNAREEKVIKKILSENKYDAIVDFMVYTTNEFRNRCELLLSKTGHYIFISSGRVFAESKVPITERTARLLDVSKDLEYLATDEYALAKARQENILRESQHKNWTIVRPTITYSKNRFQLGSLEANTIVFRSMNNSPVVLPQEMLKKHTAMTWAGDVAKMIALLVLDNTTFCEDFNACSHEYKTWGEIAQYYKELIGLTIIPIELDTYIKTFGGKYQILYSRMFDRSWDNSKILQQIGIKKEELCPIYDGLANELSNLNNITQSIRTNYVVNAKIDRFTHSRIPLDRASIKERFLYYASYVGIHSLLKGIMKK